MNNRITRRQVAKQFIIAIELLLEWIEQKEYPNDIISKHPHSDSTSQQIKDSIAKQHHKFIRVKCFVFRKK